MKREDAINIISRTAIVFPDGCAPLATQYASEYLEAIQTALEALRGSVPDHKTNRLLQLQSSGIGNPEFNRIIAAGLDLPPLEKRY